MPTGAKWYPLYESDEDFKLWFDNNAVSSPATAIERARVLYRFSRLMGWSLDELTEQVTTNRRKFEKRLMAFINKLRDEGYSPGYIENYLKAVRSWAEYHEVILLKKKSGTGT